VRGSARLQDLGSSWYWSPDIAAPHTEKQAFAEDSDDNTTNPGQDRFRVKAEKRPSRVRYRANGPVTTGRQGSSGGEAANVAFKPLKRTINL